MSISGSWLAIEEKYTDKLFSVVGLKETGLVDDCPEYDLCLIKNTGAFSVVYSRNFESAMLDLCLESSKKGRVYYCQFHEGMSYSSLISFKNGKKEWSIVFAGMQDSGKLTLDGGIPGSLQSLINKSTEKDDDDILVDVCKDSEDKVDRLVLGLAEEYGGTVSRVRTADKCSNNLNMFDVPIEFAQNEVGFRYGRVYSKSVYELSECEPKRKSIFNFFKK